MNMSLQPDNETIGPVELDDEKRRLGLEIKTRRTELNMSLRDLATMTGLSPTFISSLERGIGNPTLDSLRKVANALNAPIFRLIGGAADRSPVVRQGERKHLTLPPAHVRFEIMTPTLTRKMVAFQVRATSAEGDLVVQPLAEPTEEFLLVLAGRLRIVLAGEAYELEPGDSAYFEGRELESLHVVSDGEACYISAITPPVF
jgi:transcriptional regulator with XRE-family HTH domain